MSHFKCGKFLTDANIAELQDQPARKSSDNQTYGKKIKKLCLYQKSKKGRKKKTDKRLKFTIKRNSKTFFHKTILDLYSTT